MDFYIHKRNSIFGIRLKKKFFCIYKIFINNNKNFIIIQLFNY